MYMCSKQTLLKFIITESMNNNCQKELKAKLNYINCIPCNYMKNADTYHTPFKDFIFGCENNISNIFLCLREQHDMFSGTLHFGYMRSTKITYREYISRDISSIYETEPVIFHSWSMDDLTRILILTLMKYH